MASTVNDNHELCNNPRASQYLAVSVVLESDVHLLRWLLSMLVAKATVWIFSYSNAV